MSESPIVTWQGQAHLRENQLLCPLSKATQWALVATCEWSHSHTTPFYSPAQPPPALCTNYTLACSTHTHTLLPPFEVSAAPNNPLCYSWSPEGVDIPPPSVQVCRKNMGWGKKSLPFQSWPCVTSHPIAVVVIWYSVAQNPICVPLMVNNTSYLYVFQDVWQIKQYTE